VAKVAMRGVVYDRVEAAAWESRGLKALIDEDAGFIVRQVWWGI
jgi:hypothetical protein